MGDTEKIEYKPEELAEIERIVGFVEEGVEAPPPKLSTVSALVRKKDEEGEEETEEAESDGFEEPAAEDRIEPEDMEEAEEPVAEEEIEDISGLIQEVDEAEAATITEKPFTVEPAEAAEELPEEIPEIAEEAPEIPEEMPEIAEEPLPEEAVPGIEEQEEAAGRSPMEQLASLTRGEPESLDSDEIAEGGEFVFEEKPARRAFQREASEPVAEWMPEEAPEEAGVVMGKKEGEEEIPDLSDLSIQEAGEIPEAREEDIPEIDIGDIAAPKEEAAEPLFEDLGEPEPIEEEAAPAPREREKEDSFDTGVLDKLTSEDIDEFVQDEEQKGTFEEEPSLKDEQFEVEMLDEEPAPKKKPEIREPRKETGKEIKESIELSSGEMRRLKKAILLFNPSVRQAIKETVVNDLLPAQKTNQLVKMILSGKSEESIHGYLEKELKRTITLVDEAEAPGRKVITSRPEYTKVGRERQKRLLKATKIGGIAAAVACVLTLMSYQFIYKPYMAKKLVAEGVGLILKTDDYMQKPKNYLAAEKIFRNVDENYRRDYVDGYNAYGDAYFRQKENRTALDKYYKAYMLNPAHPDTLNNLGNFYSRVPEEFYRDVKANNNLWYFNKTKNEANDYSQLDLAIHLFKRVLTRNGDNVKALYGIGKAYFNQGQYLKAKKYYEDIIKASPDSVIGYSGLMDLYIDRDAFKLVVSVHSELANKDMLSDVPSALLAKLAGYYLTKKSTETDNVRIAYGVLSPKFKDKDDNIYPAVAAVLKALNQRDPDYPPLHLQFARFNMAQNNPTVMKRYLDKAVSLAPNYFGALHLIGEYYYYIKEPGQAYKHLKDAIDAYPNQPDFTRDDFYFETESLGKSYALMGNIFYYFSDKIEYPFGDMDDVMAEEDEDKMANYRIAMEKYEKALLEKYESPEVHYNLGRIFYLSREYRKSLDQWLNLYEDFVSRPELMFALGNAFYHLKKYEASRGEYMKMISYFEHEAERVRVPNPSNSAHYKIFRSLSSAYNNLGAIYQRQNNESKSSICYWRAEDYAKRLEEENEYARVNLARVFRPGREEAEPILDEDIPYSIDAYREEMIR